MLAPMFYLSYLVSELRRRKGRTLLTALGLGVGVGLVVTVSALTTGLDEAQDKVLKPLTGVGTDMSVTRPLKIDSEGQGPGGLSEKERDQLEQENGRTRFDLNSQAKPGEKFTRTDFMSAAQLSFPASQITKLAALEGVEDAAGSLTLSAVSISGTVPEGGFERPAPGTQPQVRRAPFDVKSLSVTGIDETKPALAAIGADQITSGRMLRSGSAREAVLNVSYAQAQRPHGRRDDQAQGQAVHRRRPRALAARRPVLRRLCEARPAAGDLRPQGPRQLGPGAGEVDQ